MLRKKCMVLILFLTCFIGFPIFSHSANRTALVIGNSNYRTAPLINPVNDARDIAQVLKSLGFEVICKVNAGRRETEDAVQQFHRNLNRAQVGFFYYAGHGMQIDGKNYLLPVDIQVKSSADIKYRATQVDWILSKMEDSGSKVNIVVLDACRNNPFRGFRGANDGLVPIQSVRGSFIAYATSPGSVAQDGSGRNGLYTSHLLQNIKKPGLTVEEVFREVRRSVAEKSNFKQIPWDSSSLMGAFYIAGAGGGNDDDRRRFEEDQARLERQRREFEQAKAEFERKQLEAKQQTVEVASLPQRPSYSHKEDTDELQFLKKLKGVWEGEGKQYNNKSSWTIKMKIAPDDYKIDYPSLNCGGNLILLSQTNDHIEFREKLTYGRNRCTDNGKIIISKSEKHKLKWLWYYSNGKLGADSVLTNSTISAP